MAVFDANPTLQARAFHLWVVCRRDFLLLLFRSNQP